MPTETSRCWSTLRPHRVDELPAIGAVWTAMERSGTPDGADEKTATPKKAKQPLWQRMYFQPHMTEIVRRMGYAELPVDEAANRLRPLFETFGRPSIEEGAAELITIDDTQSPAIARLSDEARKLAVQILGRPPESSDGKRFEPSDNPASSAEPSDDVSEDTSVAPEPSQEKGRRRNRRVRSGNPKPSAEPAADPGPIRKPAPKRSKRLKKADRGGDEASADSGTGRAIE